MCQHIYAVSRFTWFHTLLLYMYWPRSPLPAPPSPPVKEVLFQDDKTLSWSRNELFSGRLRLPETTWRRQTTLNLPYYHLNTTMSVSSWHRVQDHEGWIGRVLSGNCLLCHTHWICQLWYWLLCFWFKRPELSTRQKNLKWTVSITDAWIGYHMGDSAYDWVKV